MKTLRIENFQQRIVKESNRLITLMVPSSSKMFDEGQLQNLISLTTLIDRSCLFKVYPIKTQGLKCSMKDYHGISSNEI